VLRVVRRGLGEERGERRFELGLRVGLALGRVEEPRTVDDALKAAEQPRAIVAEAQPRGVRREILAPRLLDQLRKIRRGARRGVAPRTDRAGDEREGEPNRWCR